MADKNDSNLVDASLVRISERFDRVDDKFDRVQTSLEKVTDRLGGIDVLMVRQQAILDEHVRRTNLLEEKLETDIKLVRQDLAEDLSAAITTERHAFIKDTLIWSAKVIGVLASSGGAILGVFKFIQHFLQ